MTVEEAQAAGLIELTVPSDPNERIETQWGNCSISQWLFFEQRRIRNNPKRRATLASYDNGYLSLWVNKVSKGAQLEAVE